MSTNNTSTASNEHNAAATGVVSAVQDKVINLCGSTRDVENAHINKKVRDGYIRTLVQLMVWLFDNANERLVNLEDLQMEHMKDESTPKAKRQNLRNACKSRLVAMTRGENNSPIKLVGENSLTYDDIASFMNSKNNIVEVDKSLIEQISLDDRNASGNTASNIKSGEEQNGQNNAADIGKNSNVVKAAVRQSKSSYTAVQSAVAFLYRQNSVDQPIEMKNGISLYLKGSTRKSRKLKQDLGLKISEGKKGMKKAVYSKIAKILFESDEKKHVFAHLFLILDWNLMKRAENCVDCKINHVYFEDDCLVFEFAKSKGHQDGEDHVGPWHVYSNPLEPHICPVLSLARYIFTYPEVLSSGSPLFEGRRQLDRYSKIFHEVVTENWDELYAMGVREGDLGTHSCRKGVATMVAAGCTVSPPIVSLCIRCGWVMGGVKDRYLKYEAAGDRYVGRCACGLDQLSKEFGISPVYFDFSHIGTVEDRLNMKRKIIKWIKDRLSNSDKISPETFEVVMMAFAALCYHYQYLSNVLSAKCPLRASLLFKSIPDDIIQCAVVRHPWEKTEYTPKATGVPPHVVMMAELQEMQKKFGELRTSIREDISGILDSRLHNINSAEFHTNNILAAIEESAKKVDELLALSGTNNHSTNDQDDSMVGEFVLEDEGLTLEEDPLGENIETDEERLHRIRRNAEKSKAALKRRKMKIGYHHGRIQVLPVHWDFPQMTLRQLAENWLIHSGDDVPPLKLLSSADVVHLEGGKVKLRQMATVMSVIEKWAREMNCWVQCPSWNIQQFEQMWHKVEEKVSELYVSSNRKKEIGWKTTYNKMSRAGIFIHGRGVGGGRGRRQKSH